MNSPTIAIRLADEAVASAAVDDRAQLSALSVGDLEAALVEAQRQVNAAEARRAAVVTELLRRAQRADTADWPSPHHSHQEFVADEVAAVLSVTRAVANTMIDVAHEASTLPGLAAAWRRGDLDARKVAVVTEALRHVDRSCIGRLVESAVEYASAHTAPQLRVWLDRRVLSADPGLATLRRRHASAGRKVTLTPLADGMAELAAYLPSVQARQLYDTVNAVAMAAARDDVRSMDQRRSDALVDLVVGRAEPPQVSVDVVVTAETLLETESEPAWVSGVGAVPPDDVTDLVARAGSTTWRRLMTDPLSGVLTDMSERRYRPSASLERAVRARDLTCRFPGCRRSGVSTHSGTDLDHTVPWPRGATAASNLAVLCRHHHRLKHSGTWRVSTDPDGRMTWTTPGGRSIVTTPWAYVDPPDCSPD